MTSSNSLFSRRLGRSLLAASLAVTLALVGCKSEVYQGLTEQQANAMMSVLLRNGIDTEKTSTKTGYTLSVDSDKVVQTLELMRQNSLPQADFENMGQIFAAKGMISSATEEQARMTYALSQELSETFAQIDGVLTARVHVVLGTQDLGTGKTTEPSAAVFLRHTPASQAPHLISRVRELAANAVPGLKQENVSVMLVPVRDTITVPMLEQKPPVDEKFVKTALAAAAGILALAIAALAGAAVLFVRARRPKKDSQSEE